MKRNFNSLLLPVLLLLLQQRIVAIDSPSYIIDNPWTVMSTNFDNASVMVDFEQMKNSLLSSPHIDERAGSSTYLKMPSVNGDLVTYRFFETTVMAPALSSRFPTIKSYMGFGIKNPSHRASIIINNNILS